MPTIPQLPGASPITGAEQIPLYQNGSTRNATATTLLGQTPVLATGSTTARKLADIAASYEGDLTPASVTPFAIYGGSVSRPIASALGDLCNVRDYGAKGDAVWLSDSITCAAGSTSITFANTTFTAQDVGKVIVISSIGTGGNELVTSITAVSGSTITVANATSSTASALSVNFVFGTDDTQAVKNALYSAPGAVLFPTVMQHTLQGSGAIYPGQQGAGYLISGGLYLENRWGYPVSFVGQGFAENSGTILFHYNVAQSLASMGNGASGLMNLNIVCCNWNATAPIPAPPTIVLSGGLSLQNVSFSNAYEFSAPASGATAGGVVYADNVEANFYSRGFVLLNNGDISYFRRIRANQGGDTTGYVWSNGVLIEAAANCQGIMADQIFGLGMKSGLLVSGESLEITITNLGIEASSNPVVIGASARLDQMMSISGGYLQSNNRSDAVALVQYLSSTTTSTLKLDNLFLGNSAGIDFVRAWGTSDIRINGCMFNGNATGLSLGGGSVTVDNSVFSAMGYVAAFVNGATSGLTISKTCKLIGNANVIDPARGLPSAAYSQNSIVTIGATTQAIAVATPSANTGYQNMNYGDLQLAVQVTLNPTSTEAATAQLTISPNDGTFTVIDQISVPAGSPAGQVLTLRGKVPNGWFYAVNQTAANSVINSATGILSA